MLSFTLDKGHIVTAEFRCASIMQVSFITFSTACYGLRIKRMVTSYKTHIHLGLEWDAVNWCLVCPPTMLWPVKYLQKWRWTICDLRQWKDHISVLASPSTLRTRCPKWSYEEQSCPTFPHSYDQMKKELTESNPFFLRKKILFVKSYSLEFFQWNTKILQEQMFQQVLSAAKADSCWGCYLTTPKAQGEPLEHWKPCKWDSSRRQAVMEAHRKDKDKCCIFMTFQRLA